MRSRWILLLSVVPALCAQATAAEAPLPRQNVERLFVSGETGYTILPKSATGHDCPPGRSS